MFDLFNEFYKSAFMTEHFSKIQCEYNATTKFDRIKDKKKYRKSFAKQNSYQVFRFKLWFRSIIILIGTTVFFWVYRSSFNTILSSETINSGLILVYSIIMLVFAYIVSATLIALYSLNSFNGLDRNFNPKILGLMGLTAAYFIFLGIYFIYFEDMLINKMFLQSEPNKYKISAILDLLRTTVVFSIAGMIFKTFSRNAIHSSSTIKPNTNYYKTNKYRNRRYKYPKPHRIQNHRQK